jgi:hypothetical protein
MLSDAEQQTLTEIETGLRQDDPVLVQQFSDNRWPGRRPTRRGEIVRGWLIIGALALLSAWLLGSALLVVVGLSAIAVGVTWWAVPADTSRRGSFTTGGPPGKPRRRGISSVSGSLAGLGSDRTTLLAIVIRLSHLPISR